MPKFVFAYHGGPSSMSQEEGANHMQQWMDWMEGLGDAVVDRGLAVGPSKTAGPGGVADDGGSNPLSGYSVVEAPDMDAAVAMASNSPHVAIGGTIEVAQSMDLAM